MPNLIQNGGCISGSSDPYAILTVGAKTYQSATVNNSCDPVWNATYDFPIGKSILHCVSVYFFFRFGSSSIASEACIWLRFFFSIKTFSNPRKYKEDREVCYRDASNI